MMEDIVIKTSQYDMLKETEERYRTLMRWFEDKASLSSYDKTGITIETYGLTDFLKVVCPDNFFALQKACERKKRDEELKKDQEKKGE